MMRVGRPSKALAALLLTAASGAARAQALGSTSDEVSIWRVAGAFVLCVGIAVAAALLLRARHGIGGPALLRRNERLQLIESIRLNPQVQLCILRCDGEELLLSASASGATLVKPIGAQTDGGGS